MSYKKVGALHFFRIGRFGGSLYLAKSKQSRAERIARGNASLARYLDGGIGMMLVLNVAAAFLVGVI